MRLASPYATHKADGRVVARQLKRAKAALVPSWPQVRTFTLAQVEAEADAAQGRRATTVADGPAAWMREVEARAGGVALERTVWQDPATLDLHIRVAPATDSRPVPGNGLRVVQ